MVTSIEAVGRAIAASDGEDYMEDCVRYDARARAAVQAVHVEFLSASSVSAVDKEALNAAYLILTETPDKWPTRSELRKLARALLSSSKAEGEMREALEKIAKAQPGLSHIERAHMRRDIALEAIAALTPKDPT